MHKPPLFFIHGMWSTPHVWDGFKAHFEAAGHQVTAPALPYHDVEPDAPASPILSTLGVQDYVDALISVARDVDEMPVIIGHSMGAMLAQKLAAEMGARGLVLLSPGPTAATSSLAISPLRTLFGITKPNRKWWRQPTKIDAERARWGIFNGVPQDIADAEIGKLVWDSGRVLFQMAMPWADKTKGTAVDYDRLGMPALVMVGDQDRITPIATARATARNLTGVTDYREIAGAGHWLFHDPVSAQVTREIEAFLASLPEDEPTG